MYRLTEAFPYLLNRVGVRMGELFSRRLAADDLTLAMYRALAALWEADEQCLSDLAAVISVELSTLSRMIGTLVRRGLVSRHRPESNGRTIQITLTPKGRELVERYIPFAIQHEEISLQGFAPEEVSRLKASLDAVYDNLDALEVMMDQTDHRAMARKAGP